jgi:HD superfamily phosphohydrolase
MAQVHDPFENHHKFQDDVWGQIRLNDLERDSIDTPEFQRLFRTSQLGFVELVYHTANHTRGAHSIGACRMTNRLMNRLVDNTKDLHSKYKDEPGCGGHYADFEISPAERILVRLGALLHDISHVPLSHDLEKKSHKVFYPSQDRPLKLRSWYGHYDKHDDYEDNPLLYRLLCDDDTSVLARVLQYYSKPFWKLLQEDADKAKHRHLKEFIDLIKRNQQPDWKPELELLPQLIFHLLFYEKPDEAESHARNILTDFDNKELEVWHLGPKTLTPEVAKQWHDAWYQPYRHDIIGNTLSADLIDYLTRDPQRLGTQRRVDLHLLSYYALVNKNPQNPQKQFRCAIDLHDHKRGTTRTFILNDLFRLLDLRQDIHEKAVVHRVVQSANAMLARGLLLLGKEGMPDEDKRPSPRELVGLGESQHHALQSEDLLFQLLLEICDGQTEKRFVEARRIFEKLTERRVYRPLVIIPGDWAKDKLGLPQPPAGNEEFRDFPLRTLATIVDSAYYSPFLMFACSCVEKYVEGVFDTDADLWNYADKIAAPTALEKLLEKARNLVPSRVITWTAPYKQLYKDPAIVVALGKCVEQIDEIAKPSFQGRNNLDKSTLERIQTAIADADSKYATLWQLYVFISDGLFYTGILNKLVSHVVASRTLAIKRDDHLTRLQNAQAFLALAFKTICEFWAGRDHRHPTTEEKENVLKERMDAGIFRQLVESWAVKCKAKESWPEKWGTVDVKQYYHEFSLDETVPEEKKRPCRDSRYKFDRPSRDVWTAAANDPTSAGFKLIQFLNACRISEPKLLSEGEFKQLAELYSDEATQKRCDELAAKATSDPAYIPEALKSLWVSGFPLPGLEAEPQQADVFQMPTGRSGIRDWVFTETEILHPNVRRSVTEDIDSIVEVLERAGGIHGCAVYDDFRLRVRNESSLMWNDIRRGRAANALKRKWNHPDAAKDIDAESDEGDQE